MENIQKELIGIKAVKLEVSTDTKNFSVDREVSGTDLENAIAFHHSVFDFLMAISSEGKSICGQGKYKSYRLQICHHNETFYLFDEKFLIKQTDTKARRECPVEELKRYEALSHRERQVLCFLYRGYKQEDIAFVFGMSIHTIKKHRYNIYSKAKFRNRTELAVWCEKYLHTVFKMTA